MKIIEMIRERGLYDKFSSLCILHITAMGSFKVYKVPVIPGLSEERLFVLQMFANTFRVPFFISSNQSPNYA